MNQLDCEATKEKMLLELLAGYEARILELEKDVFVLKEMREYDNDNKKVCSEYEIRNKLALLMWFVQLGLLTDEQARESLR